MNICIDQGNSRTKVAIFDEKGRIVRHFVYRSFVFSDVERLFSLYPLTDSIVSSVVNLEPAMVNALQRLSQRFILFDHTTPVPIINDYESPETLGQDRLAAAVGAQTLCPNENLLIMDVGSAITYDFVSADGHYMGGNIAPGLKMRFTSLARMTKRLPMVEPEEHSLLPFIGRNTHDAVAAGVIRGVAYEVKGYMRTMAERMPHFRTFLTGGHAGFILNQVQGDIQYEKHLVLIGLNRILAFKEQ